MNVKNDIFSVNPFKVLFYLPNNTAVFALAALLLLNSIAVTERSSAAEISDSEFSGMNAHSAVIFIANGMGLNAKSLARIVKAGPYGRLEMDKMEYTGIIATHAADGWVTDDAAAATAISTGYKTARGLTGMLPDGRTPPSILERAEAAGLRTGLVTTGRVTHAGISPYYTSLTNKYLEDQAARTLVTGKMNVVFGGGRMSFLPASEGGLQGDNRNWIDNAQAEGVVLVNNRDELMAVSEFHSRILGFFTDGAMSMEIDRPVATQPSLSEMTNRAISMLSRSDERFILVVESGRLSMAASDHDAQSVAREITALDDAVAVALSYAERRKNMLVSVICPYESGGPVITDRLDTIAIDAGRASARTVASRIDSAGTNLHEVMKLYGNVLRLSDEEQEILIRHVGRKELPRAVGHVLSKRQGVFFPEISEPVDRWISNTGCETPVLAHGPGAHRFSGTHDNTAVSGLILGAMGFR